MNMPVSPRALGAKAPGAESHDSKEPRARDSLFLLAEITFDGSQEVHKVKVRNLSTGGMMVESDLDIAQGQRLVATLRNVGSVHGQVAWARSARFGVAFDREINPKQVRQPVGGSGEVPRYLRTILGTSPSFPR